MSDPLLVLETEFCPPLEPALVYAIYHDFDGSETERLQSAREILEPIKLEAIAEQILEFDASGSSGARQAAENNSSDIGDTSTESGATTVSRGLSSLDLEEHTSSRSGSSHDGCHDPEGTAYLDDVGRLDAATKEAILAETFSTLKFSTIAYTLRKCNNDFGRATDELLNQVYFEGTEGEEKVGTRGVDAFFNEGTPQHRGRKKKKARKDRNDGLSLSMDSSSTPAPGNKWESANATAGWISSRINLPVAMVSSVYHKTGGSTPATIQAFIKVDMDLHKDDDSSDATQLENALELHSEFPSIDLPSSISLIRLTQPSTAAAHELAKALLKSPNSPTQGGIQIIQRYAPLDLTSPPSPPRTPSLPSTHTPQSTTALQTARSTAFAQATAAHRLGRSDPLMRAAASYYSSLGRAHSAALQTSRSADADHLVSAQSAPTTLDLHGVSVKDAVRIARERVTAWYHALGDAVHGRGERPGVGGGFQIITGKGTHSDGGRGKLGPAVGGMLVREGWKVEVGSGVLVVAGVAKRK